MISAFVINPILVYTHIVAGSLGLLSGVAAMVFRKGSAWHAKAGKVYFFSMLVMAAIGAYGAYHVPEMISVVVGSLTFYLVVTAWLTVRPAGSKWRWTLVASSIVALLIGATSYFFAYEAFVSASGSKDGFAYGFYLFFGSIALICGLMDIRVILRGGVFGRFRLLRHLWRMCFSFLIAAASLFLGQPQVFPESIRETQLLMMPILGILLSLVFWITKAIVAKRFVGTY